MTAISEGKVPSLVKSQSPFDARTLLFTIFIQNLLFIILEISPHHSSSLFHCVKLRLLA